MTRTREAPGVARLRAEEGRVRPSTGAREIITIEPDDPNAPVPMMTESEARACVNAINRHMDTARTMLLDLYEREGWRALGYDSWRACVVTEFHQSQRHLYRQLDAAQVERELLPTLANGDLSESHLWTLASAPAEQRMELATTAARDHLSIKALRRIIAEKQREAPVREYAQVLSQHRGELPDGCYIELGDARRLPLADGEAHLVVTSPPYNARLGYQGYEDWLPWDDYWHGLIEPSLREAFRVLAPGGRLCLNMPNVVRTTVQDLSRRGRATQYQSRAAAERGMDAEDTWPMMIGYRLWNLLLSLGFLEREQLTWCKGQEPGQEDGPTALTSTSTAWGTFRSAVNPCVRAVAEPVYIADKLTHSREPGESDLTAEEFKRFTKNVWFIPAFTPDLDGFPAAFPEELPRRLIKLYSYPGDLVVDPFLGSGTTALAASKLGRRVYGCDVSAHNIALARGRVARGIAA